jgi:virginiamycin B lyase
MRSISKALGCLFSVALFAAVSYGSTISGTVKGPDGAPFRGAFVQAQNKANRIAVSVLTDKDGHYKVDGLGAGDFNVTVRAAGFKGDLHLVTLTADQSASQNFALDKGMVRWQDLSLYQGIQLLPDAPGKAEWQGHCFNCHGFQSRMAAVVRDEDGWKDRVNFMRTTEHYFLTPGVTDEMGDHIAAYINSVFGKDSKLTRDPSTLPGYKDLVKTFPDDVMNIAYVEYDLPGPSRMPWNADPDKNGYIWMPYYGDNNKIGRLNPKTAKVDEFSVPAEMTAGIHSTYPAPDGSVWMGEQGTNRLGHWDPVTMKITEYQDAYIPGKEYTTAGNSKHTVRVDGNGYVWATGGPLSRYDPKEGKFYDYKDEVGAAYGITVDKDGNVWFCAQGRSEIGEGDKNTGKVKVWKVPTDKSFPRRLAIDQDGIVWFGEYSAGKIGRFDPKTETFKEYVLPGPGQTPYGIAIDKKGGVWFNSAETDVIEHLDPKTGEITQYPFDHAEITIREMNVDPEGRIWYTSPANNKVGYFYLPGRPDLMTSKLPQ